MTNPQEPTGYVVDSLVGPVLVSADALHLPPVWHAEHRRAMNISELHARLADAIHAAEERMKRRSVAALNEEGGPWLHELLAPADRRTALVVALDTALALLVERGAPVADLRACIADLQRAVREDRVNGHWVINRYHDNVGNCFGLLALATGYAKGWQNDHQASMSAGYGAGTPYLDAYRFWYRAYRPFTDVLQALETHLVNGGADRSRAQARHQQLLDEAVTHWLDLYTE